MMRRHTLRTAGRMVAAGGLLALAVVGALARPVSVLPAFGIALIAATLSCALFQSRPAWPGPTRSPIRAAGRAGAAAGVGGLAVTGLWVLTGPATIPIVAAVALVGAALVLRRHVLARRWRTATSASAPAVADVVPAVWAAMSTADLCQHWRISFTLLRSVTDPRQREAIAASRRQLLDELERRDPEGFARFLASRSPADCYPAHYVRNTPGSSAS